MSDFVAGQTLTAAELNGALLLKYDAANVTSFSSGLLSSTTLSGWLTGLSLPVGLPLGTPGSANGVATLDGGGQLPLAQLPAALQGAMSYQGVWNASSNIPTLASGAGTKGYLYKVNVAGSTNLDGTTQWNVGDMAVFNGTVWDKWDGLSSEVLSVAGRTGAVVLSSSDLTDVALFAKLASPTFTGTVTVPTATAGDNTTKAASTSFVGAAVSTLSTAVSASIAALSTVYQAASSLLSSVSGLAIVAGDIIYGTGPGTVGRLPAANGVLTNTGGVLSWASAAGFTNAPDLWVRDEKTSGTTGGASIVGTVARTLNTVKRNVISGASLASNQVTLPAGTYWAQARAPAANTITQAHKLTLYNTTAGAEIEVGDSAQASGSTTHAFIESSFTLAVSSVLELRHQTSAVYANGLGIPASMGTEVYADLTIWKVA